MSDQLPRVSDGADSSLLFSTVKVKLGCCIPLLLEALAWRRDHGTGISLPLLEGDVAELEPERDPDDSELAPGLELDELESMLPPWLRELELLLAPAPDCELELSRPLPLEPDELELNAITAKSILPEPWLRIMSSIRPMRSPDELFTSAPIKRLARKACCPLRPVGLSALLLLLLESELLFMPELDDDDEAS